MELHISKLDAAKRQLEIAINLFFRSGDPIAIHTLASAAFKILDDIGQKQNIKSVHGQLLDWVKPEKRDEVFKAINAAKNFFKHADKDPDGIIKFNPESTAYYIMDATRMYLLLSKHNVPLFRLFDIWFASRYPDTVSQDNIKEALNQAVSLSGVDPNNPQSFLGLLPIIEEALLNLNLRPK
ncbi:MAG: hypothetical protein HYS74_02165 [Parcubacteria group bacterium]|nr:hypothetical protein [Parcubacteria group bacterium]